MDIFSKRNNLFFLELMPLLDSSEWIQYYRYEFALTSDEKPCSSAAQYDLDYHLQLQKHIMSSEPKDFIFKPWGLNHIWIQIQYCP